MRDDSPDPAKRSDSQHWASGSESTYRSVAELAADIGLSERSTRAALRRGEIPHIRVGHRFVLPRVAIAEWLRTAGGSVLPEQSANPTDAGRDLVAGGGRKEVTVMRRAAG